MKRSGVFEVDLGNVFIEEYRILYRNYLNDGKYFAK